MTINEAAASLRVLLMPEPPTPGHAYVRGVAIDYQANTLLVHLYRQPTADERPIPATWEGFPVTSKAAH